MKVFLIVLLIVSAVTNDIDPNYTYKDFMRQYNRTYEGEEKSLHERIFLTLDTQRFLDFGIKGMTQLSTSSWIGPKNKKQVWLDLFLAFFTYNTSHIPISSKPLKSSNLFSPFPSSFDWRSYDRVTPVKSQKSCGCCWAFSATAQYESIIAIATNGTKYDLAEQYPLQCDTNSYGCHGGVPVQSLRLFASGGGMPLESTYPYNYSNVYPDICNDTNRINPGNITIEGMYYYAGMTPEQIQQDLVTYGPLGVGVNATDPAFSYVGSSGMISCLGNSNQTNHAILLVGYNETHWIIKNSWGTNWGDNGFGYINKSADCNLKTYINQMQVNYGFSPYINPNPTPVPPSDSTLNLTITMTDAGKDGWTGYIIGIRQNNVVVGSFGSDFTSGRSSGPLYIVVKGNVDAQIYLIQKGYNSVQLGFVITAPNGTIIHRRGPGSSITAGTIFGNFCPIGDCFPNITYYLTMTDVAGDGWNGNTLAFKQNGTTISTFNLASGSSTPSPLPVTFRKLVAVNISVSVLGTSTSDIGFEIRNAAGALVFQRIPGTPFYANTILGSFCPECINLNPVGLAPGVKHDQDTVIVQPTPTEINDPQKRSYMIATYVLTSVVIILCFALGLALFKYIKILKKEKDSMRKSSENIPSAKSISSSVEVMQNL